MHISSLLTLGAALGALALAAGCGGHHPPNCPSSYGEHDRGDRDRGDRDRGGRDWDDRDRGCCGCGDRNWGDRGWDGPFGEERGWGGPDRDEGQCGGRPRGGPPPMLLDACNGKKAGDECVVKRGPWEMKSTCSAPGGPEGEARLICLPPPPPAPTPAEAAGPKPPAPAPAPKPKK